MRVMITGGFGFIGAHLREELLARGHSVVLFDGQSRDVCNETLLGQTVRFEEVEAIVNLAGALGTEELIGAERHAAQVNIIGAVNCFDVAEAAGIPVVQIATGHRGQPNTYAITKAAAEDLALARAGWQGERISVVRAYHVYGPQQKACPPHGKGHVRKIIPSFVCRALTGMNIEIYGTGQQMIDLVWAGDVAVALADAIGGPYGEVTEAGTGKPVSVMQAALDVWTACGSPSPSKIDIVGQQRRGEPLGAHVVASRPVCPTMWPRKLPETVNWYREYLAQLDGEIATLAGTRA